MHTICKNKFKIMQNMQNTICLYIQHPLQMEIIIYFDIKAFCITIKKNHTEHSVELWLQSE